MLLTYQHNDQLYTVRFERSADGQYLATIGDRTFPLAVTPLADGGWILAFDDQRVHVYAAAQGSERHVSVDGETFRLAVPETGGGRRRAKSGAGDLTAQMPGQVINVLVQEGETVEAGQTLVVLEAMKMEIRAVAPAAGRVKRLLVSKGAVVERGQRLVELENPA